MSFTLENLRSDARYFVFGDSTNTDYGNTDLDRNINRWYQTILADILSMNGDWQVNGEIAKRNLVASQSEYPLPTDILKLNKVYIKPTASDDYLEADQRDLSEIHEDNSTYNPDLPEFDLLDNSIFIFLSDSIVDVTEGLKIVYQANLTELINTTDAPNISEPFKRLLSLGAALDYCIANELNNKAKSLKVMIDEGRAALLEFYAHRSTVKPAIIKEEKKHYH